MRLEGQAVTDEKRRFEARELIVERLLRAPARLWDEI